MDDPLIEREHEALTRFGSLLEAVTEDRWQDPTPCDQWNVRELAEHTVGLTWGMAEALRSGDAEPDAYRPRPVSQWPDAESAMGRAARSASSTEERVRVRPVTAEVTFTPLEVVRIHLLDVVVHSWDLARALRLDHDPGAATTDLLSVAALVAARALPSTTEQFGPPVVSQEPPAGDWSRVLGLLGRDPGWQPPGVADPALSPVAIAERLNRFSEVWSPRIIARVNNHEIKVVKMSGSFDWHTHPETDELFLVVTGRIRIQMRHGSVELGPGDLYVVPRGVEHRPVATVPTEAVLFEPAGVVNTGDAGGPLTAVDEVLA